MVQIYILLGTMYHKVLNNAIFLTMFCVFIFIMHGSVKLLTDYSLKNQTPCKIESDTLQKNIINRVRHR